MKELCDALEAFYESSPILRPIWHWYQEYWWQAWLLWFIGWAVAIRLATLGG